jgi:hypothetical protein
MVKHHGPAVPMGLGGAAGAEETGRSLRDREGAAHQTTAIVTDGRRAKAAGRLIRRPR